MRNDESLTHAIDTATETSTTSTAGTAGAATRAPDAGRATRRTERLRRIGRRRLAAGADVLAVGDVAGTGFTLQSALASQDRIAQTAALTEATGLRHDQLGAYASIAEAKTRAQAEDTLTLASDTLAQVETKVDAGALAASVASLGDYKTLPIDTVVELTQQTRAETAKAMEAAEAHDRAEAERAAAQARANTPDGARATARDLAASNYGWGDDQFQCLDQLWTKESGWNYLAVNSSSGATGIPQALPGDKMATAGSDWATNAATQVAWGLGYIASAYGTPCSAWGHSQSVNWY
ncbi:hypothetical protein ACFPPE_07615 [Agromyces tardus]|uniref:aggregation-promoting factor C-terminal-like domain-containing protein n=1 Tax=Agromyces tardus TaxID=2583849 RepID=UPI0036142AAF